MPPPDLSLLKTVEEFKFASHYYKNLHDKAGHHQTSYGWIFHFMDIIYVAVVYTIGQLFENCGINEKVFFIAAAYFGIMFSTRMFFDAYAYTFTIRDKNEVPRILIFILYCLGVYNMTLNIGFDTTQDDSSAANYYGLCKRNIVYDNGFAISFICTRLLLILLYLFHLFTVHDFVRANPDAYTRLLYKKIIPSILSITTMCFIFLEYSPVAVFSAVAGIEFACDIISESLACLPKDLMPDPPHFQERLGLMFMLVLGESMVGLLFHSYNDSSIQRTYGSVVSAFFLVSAIGMQFFERAQSDPHPLHDADSHDNSNNRNLSNSSVSILPGGASSLNNSFSSANSAHMNILVTSIIHDNHYVAPTVNGNTHGSVATDTHTEVSHCSHNHPLIVSNDGGGNKLIYSAYVWLHALISFFMLLATSSIVSIYYDVSGLGVEEVDDHSNCTSDVHHHYDYQLEKAKVTGGLVAMWFCMLLMEVLQPSFRKNLRSPFPWGCSNFWTVVFEVEQKNKDNLYSKFIFVVKIVVMCLHIMFFFITTRKGNYFIGITAVIAGFPTLFDIIKLTSSFLYELSDTLREYSLYTASQSQSTTPQFQTRQEGAEMNHSLNARLSKNSAFRDSEISI